MLVEKILMYMGELLLTMQGTKVGNIGDHRYLGHALPFVVFSREKTLPFRLYLCSAFLACLGTDAKAFSISLIF